LTARGILRGAAGQDVLRMFWRHVAILTALNLAWEFAQMPLYTIGRDGTARAIAFAGLHCTAGDALIGGFALLAALVIGGHDGWPGRGRGRVLATTVAFGLGYTVFSEWLNVEWRGAWAYSDLMPVLPVTGTGLAPVVQWLTLPVVAAVLARRRGPGGGARDRRRDRRPPRSCGDPGHAEIPVMRRSRSRRDPGHAARPAAAAAARRARMFSP